MRVVAVTQSDPFFTGAFFTSFLEDVAAQPVELLEIAVLRNFDERRSALALRLLRLYGPVGMTRLASRYLRARLSERRGQPHMVEAVAALHGVRIRHLGSINAPEYLAELRHRRVDVLLSVAAPEIFGPDALATAPLALNVHSGKLPDYRGMMPTFWALLNGEREIIVTVHEMTARVDEGSVLAEYPVAIGADESAFELAARAKRIAGREVAHLLGRLATEAPRRQLNQRRGNGRYYGFPRRADARLLRSRGRRLL